MTVCCLLSASLKTVSSLGDSLVLESLGVQTQ